MKPKQDLKAVQRTTTTTAAAATLQASRAPSRWPTVISPAFSFKPIAINLLLLLSLATSTSRQQILSSNNHQAGASTSLQSSSSSPHGSFIRDVSGPISGKIQTLDVICGKNFMTVRAEFSGPFYGIVFSKGTYGHENCIYVKPNSGLTHAAFNVYYDQCGTKPDLQGKFYENTVVIQYGSDIIEAYDEAKRLRCEWFEAYEKPATFKPAIPVADLEVVEMNFQGDDIDCWMEIQEGAGPMSREVSKIVPVGQPMTIVVAINDYNGQFDMRVKSCVAHDGVQQPIALTDEFGCVLRPKMLTPFQKLRNPGGIHKKATILSYSRFLAFKFPDSMTVQIQCTVEVCRHGCADACQRVPSIAATTMQPELSLTAKWPSAPNQPAMIAANEARPPASIAELDAASQRYSPSRVPFARPAPPPEESASAPFGRQQSYNQAANDVGPSSGDDMNGSESNQHPSISGASNGAAQQQQQPVFQAQPQQQQRRSQDNGNIPLDGRVPQYLSPNRRLPAHGQRISAGIATSTTTSTSTTTTTTTTELPPASDNRAASGDDNPPEAGNDDSSMTRLGSDQSNKGEPSSDAPVVAVVGEQQNSPTENKQEAGQPKPQVVDAPNSGEPSPVLVSQSEPNNQPPPAGQNNNDQNNGDQLAEASENKPSVQGGGDDDQIKPVDQSAESQQPSQSSSSSSSLKTVEVEIPANEDPVRAFMSANANANINTNQQSAPGNSPGFQSVRLSNVDLSQSNGGPVSFESGYSSDHSQVIQPRDQQQGSSSLEKRDKDDETNFEAASQLMGSGKVKFGARSPQPSSSHNDQSRHSNHQLGSSVEQSPSSSSSSSSAVDSADKVLIDRSDDSSSLTEIAVPVAPDRRSSESISPDQSGAANSDMASEESSIMSGKVRPVVGTDELPTGPIQLEDRIGSAAQQPQESLEEALNRLQHQIPQTAALVSGAQPASSQATPDNQQDLQRVQEAQMAPKDSADDRSDSSSARKPQQQHQTDNVHKVASSRQTETISQPHPNVAGQAKVLPDPSGIINNRGSMLAQATNPESVKQILPAPIGMLSQEQLIKQQQQQQQQMQVAPIESQPKPVAQITNVPISLGFPPSQIPDMQQLSQQLAQFQQQQHQHHQQQQQQQQQPKSTTSKPALRSRFNLLNPQAALQAVASRLLPKSSSSTNQQQQQQQQQSVGGGRLTLVGQQLPQLLSNMKSLSPEQQQQFLANAIQQQQQFYNMANGLAQPHAMAAKQQPATGGLFNRLSGLHSPQQQQQPQQPLVRNRRSAIMPNGRRGNGELGMTKTFMVVTGMDLAFNPNLNDTELPQILEGRRLVDAEGDVVYGICMPIVSLTFVLTCAFWLIVFLLGFCIYMLAKSRRQRQDSVANKLMDNQSM